MLPHILDNRHSYRTIHDTIEILRTIKKGQCTNKLERYHDFKNRKTYGNILNDICRNQKPYFQNYSKLYKVIDGSTYIHTYLPKGAYYAGIKLFNSLPDSIKSLNHDIKLFKLALKCYLLSHSSYSVEEFTSIENY
jgi:hypothetical protein